ncbi:MAG: toll/interleukin-1 receptor domain-containing protein [Blastocatellales bacterium]
MRDIFISYVHEDREIAEELAAKFEEAGYTTWYYTRDNLSGDYVKEITEAIGQCQAFALIISPNSVNKPNQVYPEIVQAHEGGKTLIPLRSNISHPDFKKLRPEWAFMLASRVTTEAPPGGIGAIVPGIVKNLREEGKLPNPDATGPLSAQTSIAEALRSPIRPDPKTAEAKPPTRLKYYMAAVAALALIGLIAGYFLINSPPPQPEHELFTGIYTDNFDKVNFWTPPIPALLVQNNSLHLEEQSLIYVSEDKLWAGDFIMQFHLKLQNAGGAAWAVRVKDPNNYYFFYLAGPESGEEEQGYFYTYKVRDGSQPVLTKPAEKATMFKLTPNDEYVIYVFAKGNEIAHKINPVSDSAPMDSEDELDGWPLGYFKDSNDPFLEGSVGFLTWGQEKFSVVAPLTVIPGCEKLPKFVLSQQQ